MPRRKKEAIQRQRKELTDLPDSEDIANIKKIIKVQAVYHPRKENTAVYDRILPVFRNLYTDNKKSFAALNAEG